MRPVDPVAPDELIVILRRDRRVERVRIGRYQGWSWERGKNGDGQEFHTTGTVEIQPNTEGHGAGGRGIAAGSGPLTVAHVEFTTDGLINACELVHAQQYGLVRLVADALGVAE